MTDQALVNVKVWLAKETSKALLVREAYDREHHEALRPNTWVPKSACTRWPKKVKSTGTLLIRRWCAVEKRLI